MKKVQLASFLLLVLTLLVMAVNRFAAVLPDWAVRTVGVMLLSLAAASCFVGPLGAAGWATRPFITKYKKNPPPPAPRPPPPPPPLYFQTGNTVFST